MNESAYGRVRRAAGHRFPRVRAVPGRMLFVVALTLGVGACLEIETRVKVNENGSATITERLRFSQRLLDMGSAGGPVEDIATLLTKEATLERMKQMGKGIRLAEHQVREAEKGSRESIAVFKIPDISEFRYVSPYLASLNYPKHNVLACKMFPIYESTWYGRRAGQMAVTFSPTTRERRRGKPEESPKPPSPVDLQALRDLSPLFRDLMKDFTLRLTFETYAPLRFRQYYRYRGYRSITHTYDLIDFSDANLDNFGGTFLGNEEIILELMQGQMGGPNVVEHVKNHAENLTLPVFHPSGTPEIYFNPTRALFDKYFKGKTLTFSERNGGARPARFEEIGYPRTPPSDRVDK